MTRLRLLPTVALAALVAVLLVLSGCADEPADEPAGAPSGAGTASDTGSNGDPARDPAPDPSTDPTTDSPSGTGSMVAVGGVVVERGGGLSGSADTFRVGLNDEGAPEVLTLAAMLPVADDGEVSETPCCDISTYAVTVHYASGEKARFHTYDGDDGPVHELAMAVLALTDR